MSTYKVIQDIEAEDKLVGPLSFRQFVYFLIGAFLGYLNFICIAKGAAFLIVLFGPPMLFCFFFAWPWSPDQPTEVWALARIRFLLKSRKRVWDQSGIKEFVTVTVPKKIERHYTDGLSQTEVRSRLQALAQTIDTRGWAVKNANVNMNSVRTQAASDRLLDFSVMPQQVSDNDIRARDDILDETNNSFASRMGQMIDTSTKARRQQLIDRLKGQEAAVSPVPQWFQRNPAAGPVTTNAVAGLPTVDVAADLPQPTARPSANEHLKTLTPPGQFPDPAVAQMPATQPAAAPVSAAPPIQPVAPTMPAPNPAILNLAHDNNLDVATLAREAHRVRDMDASDSEVVVPLH